MVSKYRAGDIVYLADSNGTETEYRIYSISERTLTRVYNDISLLSPDNRKLEILEETELDRRIRCGTARLAATPGKAVVESAARLAAIGLLAGIIEGRQQGSEGLVVIIKALCDKCDRPVGEILSSQIVERLKRYDAEGYETLAKLYKWSG